MNQSIQNNNSSNNNMNTHTIVDLRKIQASYETKIFNLVDQLDQYSLNRGSDYKECESMARQAAKMCARWKRLTSLTVEALVELDHEIVNEEQEKYKLDTQIAQLQSPPNHANPSTTNNSNNISSSNANLEEIHKLQQVLGLVQHFVARTEQHSLQQQLPNVPPQGMR